MTALGAWLESRLGLAGLWAVAKKKEVPVHRHTLWYYLGGMTLFLFVVQIGTGVLLLFYYRPSAEEAFESVQFLMAEVQFGWLIRSIQQRQRTILKVTKSILKFQREFFEKGVEYLKPLTLREVADVISMHESTVSRVTNEKYVQTPRGLLPLKFFFSSGLQTTTGEDASARAIKAQIEKLVSDEDTRNPLTDQQIVEHFAGKGVRIARRTVAKYRDQLGILPARMRKRL